MKFSSFVTTFLVVALAKNASAMLGDGEFPNFLESRASKGSRSTKGGGKKVCLLEGFQIRGSTQVTEGPTSNDVLIPCGGLLPDCQKFLECADTTEVFDSPFWFNRDVGPTTKFQFKTDQRSLGDGAFYGEIGTTPADKVTVEYYDLDYYNTNTLVEFINYDYFIEVCPPSRTCGNDFYLNVYTRQNAGVTYFFDCVYNFVPTTAALPTADVVGQWNTFKTLPTAPTSVRKFSGSTVIGNCPSTLQAAIDQGYVLGTNFCGLIFVFNMGDSLAFDNGLKGYFDNIQIKFAGQDLLVYDFEP